MKKTFSIILAAAMVLGMLSVIPMTAFATSTPAPVGDPINSEADFLAMDPAKDYYLNADITITKTYGLLEYAGTPFTGNFDGNGKTITVDKVPMFHTFSGNIKNLNLKGEVTTAYGCTQTSDANPTVYNFGDVGTAAIAAFAIAPEGKTLTFDKITSEAKVDHGDIMLKYINASAEEKENRAAAGALYGIGSGNITVTNCVNNGEIIGGDQVGGLVGWADRLATTTFTIKNCVNNGAVTTYHYGGGLVGRGSEGATTIDGCVNNGTIKAYDDQMAGIIGYMAAQGNVSIKNCYNKGVATKFFPDGFAADNPNYGGIFGSLTASKDGISITIEKCSNSASFSYNEQTAGLVGGIGANVTFSSRKDVKMVVKDCVNTGSLKNGSYAGGIISTFTTASKKATKGGCTLDVINCVNTGSITADKYVGGIVCRAGTSTGFAITTYERCLNTGKLTGGDQVGGISAYQYGSGTTSYAIITGCANLGNIFSTKWAAQILAYGNNNNMKITNNLAAGKVECEDDNHSIFIGLSSADVKEYTIKDNYYIENDGIKTYSYADKDENAKNRVKLADMPEGAIIYVTQEQLRNGEIATALNTKLGKEIFVSTGTRTTIPCNDEFLIHDGICTYCGPYTGDSTSPSILGASIAMMFVSFVGIVGVAVYFNRKKKIAE